MLFVHIFLQIIKQVVCHPACESLTVYRMVQQGIAQSKNQCERRCRCGQGHQHAAQELGTEMAPDLFTQSDTPFPIWCG